MVPSGTSDKGVVEVTNCFCVPHKEHADQVEAELNYAMDVYELNRRVNASENIVGEFACYMYAVMTVGVKLCLLIQE